MDKFIREEHSYRVDRELLYIIAERQDFLYTKIAIFMSQAATDLQALVDQLTTGQAQTKTSLDAIKSGVATIVAGIPDGGLTADEVAALKASLTAAVATETANASEAGDDAAAVAAAQPAASPVETSPATDTTVAQ